MSAIRVTCFATTVNTSDGDHRLVLFRPMTLPRMSAVRLVNQVDDRGNFLEYSPGPCSVAMPPHGSFDQLPSGPYLWPTGLLPFR